MQYRNYSTSISLNDVQINSLPGCFCLRWSCYSSASRKKQISVWLFCILILQSLVYHRLTFLCPLHFPLYAQKFFYCLCNSCMHRNLSLLFSSRKLWQKPFKWQLGRLCNFVKAASVVAFCGNAFTQITSSNCDLLQPWWFFLRFSVAFFLFLQRFYWASLIKIRMRFEKLEHEQESLLLHRFTDSQSSCFDTMLFSICMGTDP